MGTDPYFDSTGEPCIYTVCSKSIECRLIPWQKNAKASRFSILNAHNLIIDFYE